MDITNIFFFFCVFFFKESVKYILFFEFGDRILNLEICGSLVNLIMLCKAKATSNSPPEIFPSCLRSGYKYFVMSGYKCHNQVLSLQTESISGTNVTIKINA